LYWETGSAAAPIEKDKENGAPSVTRTQTSNDAGSSEHQRKTAIRVSRIPDPDSEFEA